MSFTFKTLTMEESMNLMFHEKALMIKIADFLLKEKLITLEEQAKVVRLIRESEIL